MIVEFIILPSQVKERSEVNLIESYNRSVKLF